jgi:hypothetical protein
MEETALAALDELRDDAGDHCSYCIYRPEWHQGVVGIVAARIKDRYHRPAIVFANGTDGELKGSGRSIAGFHLRDALDLVAKRVPGVITRFGGHAYAAGVSIVPGGLAAFGAALERVARERLTDSDLRQTIESDGMLGPVELTFGLAERLAEPVWGQGFAAPSFDDTFDVLDQRIVGGAHTRLMLGRDPNATAPSCFGTPRRYRHGSGGIPSGNQRVQGTASLQLLVRAGSGLRPRRAAARLLARAPDWRVAVGDYHIIDFKGICFRTTVTPPHRIVMFLPCAPQ